MAMRILVVEDEHKIANALKRGLEQEQYAVDLAFDGKEGLGFALTEPYDLVILDRNPLEDIRHTLSVERVMKDGVLRDAYTLDETWPTKTALPAWNAQAR